MPPGNDFEKAARAHGDRTFAGELWSMLRQNKKYWMIPIIVVLLLLGTLIFLSGTAAAPFIYTLF